MPKKITVRTSKPQYPNGHSGLLRAKQRNSCCRNRETAGFTTKNEMKSLRIEPKKAWEKKLKIKE